METSMHALPTPPYMTHFLPARLQVHLVDSLPWLVVLLGHGCLGGALGRVPARRMRMGGQAKAGGRRGWRGGGAGVGAGRHAQLAALHLAGMLRAWQRHTGMENVAVKGFNQGQQMTLCRPWRRHCPSMHAYQTNSSELKC